MTEQQVNLHQFFSEKAKHLQHEIDLEMDRIGGVGHLLSREDLIHWYYYSCDHVEMYKTICQLLGNNTGHADIEQIRRELRETMQDDLREIVKLRRKIEEEKKVLEQMMEETEYYRQALEVLG